MIIVFVKINKSVYLLLKKKKIGIKTNIYLIYIRILNYLQ